MSRAFLVAMVLAASLQTGCSGGVLTAATLAQRTAADTPTSANIWVPAPGTTWQWQLTGALDSSFDVDVYDIDLFDIDMAQVTALTEAGRKTVCYMSAGSLEDWRPDAGSFPPEVIGKDYTGWSGEKWLDIRRIDLLAAPLLARLDLCRDKGFDAVEPDNIDGYTNDTGFPLTAEDQLAFNRWLADKAHERGLSIGLKNDSGQAAELLESFDWALSEDCHDEGWCEDFAPFVAAGKAHFAAEYTDTATAVDFGSFCQQALSQQISPIQKGRNLDAPLTTCP